MPEWGIVLVSYAAGAGMTLLTIDVLLRAKLLQLRPRGRNR